jgi:hypothetical protein
LTPVKTVSTQIVAVESVEYVTSVVRILKIDYELITIAKVISSIFPANPIYDKETANELN